MKRNYWRQWASINDNINDDHENDNDNIIEIMIEEKIINGEEKMRQTMTNDNDNWLLLLIMTDY